jgi:hypothetical protein
VLPQERRRRHSELKKGYDSLSRNSLHQCNRNSFMAFAKMLEPHLMRDRALDGRSSVDSDSRELMAQIRA